MPEIKHGFAGGKMNKDLDERLVPNGEYRNAMNVQVRTTSGGDDGVGDAGSLQNIRGNKAVLSSVHHETPYADNFTPSGNIIPNQNVPNVVGSVAHEKTNKAYFFVAGTEADPIIDTGVFDTNVKLFIDTIVEVDTGTGTQDPEVKPVLVDKYGILSGVDNVLNVEVGGLGGIVEDNTTEIQVDTALSSQLRKGMKMIAYGTNFDVLEAGQGVYNTMSRNQIYDVTDDGIIKFVKPFTIDSMQSTPDQQGTWGNISCLYFFAPRVLEFDINKKVSAINVLDDLLMWSDGVNEPKRLNIQKCKKGTPDYTTHTHLVVKNPDINSIGNDGDLVPIFPPQNPVFGLTGQAETLITNLGTDIKKSHITAIRKKPEVAPLLEMSSSTRTGTTRIDGFYQDFIGNDSTFGPGSIVSLTSTELAGNNWQINDVLIFTEEIVDDTKKGIIRATIDNYDPTDTNGSLQLTIISVNSDYQAISADVQNAGFWTVELDDREPLFELKMGRFGARYKYDNGEYSAFGPWSELAFLPGSYDYNHKKGYNLGMVNVVRSLKIRRFIPHQRVRPLDVVAVDVLWKTTESPNVYVVKTISRGKDPEWDAFTNEMGDNVSPDDYTLGTGELSITSEMIHRVVEKNQLLRAWDNVPRRALAQEIAANRVIYGNYTQGYDISSAVGLKQNIKHYSDVNENSPKKSVKSMRNYKWGMVFGDKYGRETPVITGGYLQGESEENTEMQSGDISLGKQFSAFRNTFELKQVWDYGAINSNPDNWIEYVKYYVKETSNEYYNLIMDRWYEAEDGNLWISFASADRNKVDEETYINLKTKHGSSEAVTVNARYKVLAIENEPPDFIRVEPRIMGKVRIDDADYPPDAENNLYGVFSDVSFTTQNNAPDLLMKNNSVKLSQWSNFLKDYVPKGDLQVRVCGKIDGSDGEEVWKHSNNWQTITYYGTTETDGTGPGIVRWRNAFGTSANLIPIFQGDLGLVESEGGSLSDATDGLTYYLEFRENVVVTTAAQFEGKFFVKIERDDILETSVMNFTDASTEYVPGQTWNLGYVDSRNTNPASSNIVDGIELHPRFQYQWLNDSGSDGDVGISATVSNTENNFQPNQDGQNVANLSGLWNQWSNGNGAFAGDLTPQQAGGFLALGCSASAQGTNSYNEGGSNDSIVNWGNYTRRFWDWHSNPFGGASGDAGYRMFIDSARTKWCRMTGGSNPVLNEFFFNSDGDGDGSLNRPFIYYKPTGLDHGFQTGSNGQFQPTLSNNHFGRLTISTWDGTQTSGTGPWDFQEKADLKAHLTQPGNKFVFEGDPDRNIYQVVGVTEELEAHNYSVIDTSVNTTMPDGVTTSYDDPDGLLDYQLTDEPTLVNILFGGQEIITGGAGNCTGDQGFGCDPSGDMFCKRSGFRFEFRLFDREIGQLAGTGDQGLDPTVWDPRGTVCHDGRESLQITSLTPATLFGDYIPPVGNAACWETEPKEDVGLDLYYEASEAVPMRLNSDNARNFIPQHAKVTLRGGQFAENYIAWGDSGDPEDPGTPQIDHRVFHVGYNYEGSFGGRSRIIVGIEARTNAETSFLPYTVTDVNTSGNAIETSNSKYFVFEHQNGMKTMSRIIRHMGPIDNDGNTIPITLNFNGGIGGGNQAYYSGVNNSNEVRFVESTTQTGFFEIEQDVWKYSVELPWHNCWSFGNGVESDRIRDDFNAPRMDNGVKVSTTFLEFGEEQKPNGLIYSGIYNSISGVNNLNEFNQAEKITKDLNPSYGSIQALKTRDTDLVVFTEDKLLKVITNKDALFNADGNAQLTATNRVLGTAIPFSGDYGISQNPESLAWDQFRLYFTDMQRGAVLRLSGDGLTPISNVGMKTWFRNNLKKTKCLIGSFDVINGEYNLTLNYKSSYGVSLGEDTTVSFNEASKGWVSFKSFIPQSGVSVGGKYITGKQLKPTIPVGVEEPQSSFTIWEHHKDIIDNNSSSLTFGKVINRNVFYAPNGIITAIPEVQEIDDYFTPSSVDVMFNDIPSSVKSFTTVSYEGSQGLVRQFTSETVYDSNGNLVSNYIDSSGAQTLTDGEYYNLEGKKGWWVDRIITDQSSKGSVHEFKEKEGKWYNRIDGADRGEIEKKDLNEFSVQGLGYIAATPESTGTTLTSDEELSGTGDCIITNTDVSSVDNGDGTITVTTTTVTWDSCTDPTGENIQTTTVVTTEQADQPTAVFVPSTESVGYQGYTALDNIGFEDDDGDGVDDNIQ